MSPSPSHRTRTIDDFLDLLADLAQEGVDAAVIGGIAVSAYGRLVGDEIYSADLDLYTDSQNLHAMLAWARRRGITPRKVPQARAIPVAVFDWNGMEISVLTSSHGLASPDVVVGRAREFHFTARPGLEVLIADPFDLLANKLCVRRAKDMPHIEVLRKVVEEEVVRAFREETIPRARLAPARRLLKVTASRTLPEALSDRLISLARTPTDLRFLMNHAPSVEQAKRILGRAPGDEGLAEIRRSRRFRKQR